jgi:hypothetical protein
VYRSEPDGGPDAKESVGVPDGITVAAKRCTEANRTVGPTLKEEKQAFMVQILKWRFIWRLLQ